jgi:ankyrin repeat protein
VQTAKALLDAGANINAVHEIPDDNEIFPATALWYAVARGLNRELVKFLLGAGANPDHCLWAVVWSSDLETARLLLKAGSQTELKFGGETPLLYAARLGREPLILELVRANASIHVRDSHGKTPLDHALKKRLNDSVIAALRSGPSE